jgi:hypothetical protein
LDIVRSSPIGHVAAVLGAMRRLGMAEIIGLDGIVGSRLQALVAARFLEAELTVDGLKC